MCSRAEVWQLLSVPKFAVNVLEPADNISHMMSNEGVKGRPPNSYRFMSGFALLIHPCTGNSINLVETNQEQQNFVS